MNAVIDEDLPRSLKNTLSLLGFLVMDIRDHNLRGASDDTVFLFAQTHKAILFSGDLGFANTLRFPLGTHAGIVILRFPNELSVKRMNEEVYTLLHKVKPTDFLKNLVIVSPGKIRVKKQSIQ